MTPRRVKGQVEVKGQFWGHFGVRVIENDIWPWVWPLTLKDRDLGLKNEILTFIKWCFVCETDLWPWNYIWPWHDLEVTSHQNTIFGLKMGFWLTPRWVTGQTLVSSYVAFYAQWPPTPGLWLVENGHVTDLSANSFVTPFDENCHVTWEWETDNLKKKMSCLPSHQSVAFHHFHTFLFVFFYPLAAMKIFQSPI